MAEEGANPESVVLILDLERFGEVLGAAIDKFTKLRDIDPPNYEDGEMRQVLSFTLDHVMHMIDRAQFTASVQTDLAMLDELTAPPSPEPQHRPEFGGAAPIGWDPLV